MEIAQVTSLNNKHDLRLVQCDGYNVYILKLLILIPASLASFPASDQIIFLDHQLWIAGILPRLRFICRLNVHEYANPNFSYRWMLLWQTVSHSNSSPCVDLITEPIDRSMKYYWPLALPPGDRCRQEMCHSTAVNLLWIWNSTAHAPTYFHWLGKFNTACHV